MQQSLIQTIAEIGLPLITAYFIYSALRNHKDFKEQRKAEKKAEKVERKEEKETREINDTEQRAKQEVHKEEQETVRMSHYWQQLWNLEREEGRMMMGVKKELNENDANTNSHETLPGIPQILNHIRNQNSLLQALQQKAKENIRIATEIAKAEKKEELSLYRIETQQIEAEREKAQTGIETHQEKRDEQNKEKDEKKEERDIDTVASEEIEICKDLKKIKSDSRHIELINKNIAKELSNKKDYASDQLNKAIERMKDKQRLTRNLYELLGKIHQNEEMAIHNINRTEQENKEVERAAA